MTIGKDLRKVFKPQNIVIIAGIIIIGVALCHYGNQKNLTQQGFSENTISNSIPPSSSGNSGFPVGTPSILPDDAAKVNLGSESQTQVVPPPNCTQQPVLNPADLLPKESGGTNWNEAAPSSNGAMNFLDSGYLAGINTVSGSLRNANQQLRSEPPNPTSLVSPWMNSTIEPDLMRAPFEIGCGCPGDSQK
tara:strand:- start:194 stop:766 length:573 start_codon:yes stop_codon:yes gene_type:complete